ncbi:MAG TPA: hypothetical protein GXX72_02050 [Clostridiaceae bacterium]|nr:hypothetical protein [Clostridiaceae bacterium]
MSNAYAIELEKFCDDPAELEVLTVMENMYYDLLATGKSEDDALNVVLNEFGQREQATDSFNRPFNDNGASNRQQSGSLYLSNNDVEKYLLSRSGFAKRITVGVMLCLLSPTLLIGIGGYREQSGVEVTDLQLLPGLIFMFIMVTIAVAIFILTGLGQEKWESLENNIIVLEDSKKSELERVYDNESKGFAVKIVIGVVMIMLAVLTIIVVATLAADNAFHLSLGVIALLTIIALAIPFLIIGGIRRNSLQNLLNVGSYTPEAREANRVVGLFSGPYWILVVATYLTWSFVSGDWRLTWILWPIAGVVFVVLTSIIDVIKKKSAR